MDLLGHVCLFVQIICTGRGPPISKDIQRAMFHHQLPTSIQHYMIVHVSYTEQKLVMQDGIVYVIKSCQNKLFIKKWNRDPLWLITSIFIQLFLYLINLPLKIFYQASCSLTQLMRKTQFSFEWKFKTYHFSITFLSLTIRTGKLSN